MLGLNYDINEEYDPLLQVIFPMSDVQNTVLQNVMFALDRYQRTKEALQNEDSGIKISFTQRIMLVEYKEKDWIFDLCQAVEKVINDDKQTNKYIKFHHIHDISEQMEASVIEVADLSPEILEEKMKYRNDERFCTLPKLGKSFGELDAAKVFETQTSLSQFEKQLEMMYYGYEEGEGVFFCLDDLILTNDIYDEK